MTIVKLYIFITPSYNKYNAHFNAKLFFKLKQSRSLHDLNNKNRIKIIGLENRKRFTTVFIFKIHGGKKGEKFILKFFKIFPSKLPVTHQAFPAHGIFLFPFAFRSFCCLQHLNLHILMHFSFPSLITYNYEKGVACESSGTLNEFKEMIFSRRIEQNLN